MALHYFSPFTCLRPFMPHSDPHFYTQGFGFCSILFLRGKVASLTLKPQHGGPGEHSFSGLYPSTCPVRVTLAGVESPAGIALSRHGNRQASKPPYHSLQGGGDPIEVAR